MKKPLLTLILLLLCLASCKGQPLINELTPPSAESNVESEQIEENLLTANDLIDISVSAPEGSGGIRTLTIRYKHGSREESAVIDNVKRIDLEGYDDEKKEQTFAVSDYDGDGIFDIIIYREFWFSDLNMSHPEVPEWPVVYEYDTDKGFVIASSNYRDYFKTYINVSEEQLTEGKEHMSDVEKLALKRLIFAAGQIVNGSFTPQSLYNGQYYEDVYELAKDIDELTGFYNISESGIA